MRVNHKTIEFQFFQPKEWIREHGDVEKTERQLRDVFGDRAKPFTETRDIIIPRIGARNFSPGGRRFSRRPRAPDISESLKAFEQRD